MRAADAILLLQGAHFRLLSPAPTCANMVTTMSKLCIAGTTTSGRTNLHTLAKLFIGLPLLPTKVAQLSHSIFIVYVATANTSALDAPPSASQACQIPNYHYTNHYIPSFWRWD